MTRDEQTSPQWMSHSNRHRTHGYTTPTNPIRHVSPAIRHRTAGIMPRARLTWPPGQQRQWVRWQKSPLPSPSLPSQPSTRPVPDPWCGSALTHGATLQAAPPPTLLLLPPRAPRLPRRQLPQDEDAQQQQGPRAVVHQHHLDAAHRGDTRLWTPVDGADGRARSSQCSQDGCSRYGAGRAPSCSSLCSRSVKCTSPPFRTMILSLVQRMGPGATAHCTPFLQWMLYLVFGSYIVLCALQRGREDTLFVNFRESAPSCWEGDVFTSAADINH